MALSDNYGLIEKLFFSASEERFPTEEEASAALTKITELQGSYHPLYGLDSRHHARLNMMKERCDIVRGLFHSVPEPSQIRILDVGTNVGFVPLELSADFPHVVGLDINNEYVACARYLAQKNGRGARFYQEDIFERIFKKEPIDLYNVDCIILLNVIHQIIFAWGFEATRRAIALLSQSVDFLVVELAERSEYEGHPSAREIPVDLTEIFSDCKHCTIETVAVRHPYKDRSLHIVRRNMISAGDTQYRILRTAYSANSSIELSRKYYLSDEVVVKEYRALRSTEETRFTSEITSLEAMRGMPGFPALISNTKAGLLGRIVITRVHGPMLSDLIQLKMPRAPKKELFLQVCELVCRLFDCGVFQNDFSAHNMIVDHEGRLQLYDFDRAGPLPTMEPFGALCWLLSDLLLGNNTSYHLNISQRLESEFASDNSRKILPSKEPFSKNAVFASVYDAIQDSVTYGELIDKLKATLLAEPNRSLTPLKQLIASFPSRVRTATVEKKPLLVTTQPVVLTEAPANVSEIVVPMPDQLSDHAIEILCQAVLGRIPAASTIDWLRSNAQSPGDVLTSLASVPEARTLLLGIIDKSNVKIARELIVEGDKNFMLGFDQTISPKLGKRGRTFRLMFEKLLSKRKRGHFIIETGSLRIRDNWEGDGQSTYILGEFCRVHGGTMFSVDSSLVSVDTARLVAPSCVNTVYGDSVDFLRTMAQLPFSRKVDLLYLDSYDVDFDNPLPSSQHHLKELEAVRPLIGAGTIIAVDDTFLSEGKMKGKGQLLQETLSAIGARLLDVEYQAVWEVEP